MEQSFISSVMDSSISINENNWAITLTMSGIHAVILAELYVNGEYEIRKYDLVMSDRKNLKFFESHSASYFGKGKGEVRGGEVVGISKKADIHRHFATKNLSQSYIMTWACKASRVRVMQADINREIQNNNTPNAVSFDVKGIHKGEGHSCITWAEEKLRLAGITLNNNSECTRIIDGSLGRDVTPLHVSDQMPNNSWCVLS